MVRYVGWSRATTEGEFHPLRSELWVEVNIVVFFLIASAIFDDTRLEEAEKILAGLRSIQNI